MGQGKRTTAQACAPSRTTCGSEGWVVGKIVSGSGSAYRADPTYRDAYEVERALLFVDSDVLQHQRIGALGSRHAAALAQVIPDDLVDPGLESVVQYACPLCAVSGDLGHSRDFVTV